MNANELKEYIISNDKAYLILEDLGFHKLKDNGEYITCAVPNYNNPQGFSMLKENLYCNSFTTNFSFKGHIFDLVMHIKKCEFGDCMRYIHKLLDLKYEYNGKETKPKDSILDFFKRYDRKNKDKKSKEIKTYTEEEINRIYDKCPYLGWVREGILPNIQEEFGVGFHYDSKRVVLPHRQWNSGLYVGLIGRTLRSDTEIELLGIAKYFPIIKYFKSQNLYGLYENMEYIKSVGEVIVFEAEKSVLKMASKGIRNCVAVCSHDLSDEQIKILISLDVDITIAYDKDIEEEFLKDTCKRFNGMRNIYYIYDSMDLLKEKQSPADVHYKVWNVLYRRKIKYKE